MSGKFLLCALAVLAAAIPGPAQSPFGRLRKAIDKADKAAQGVQGAVNPKPGQSNPPAAGAPAPQASGTAAGAAPAPAAGSASASAAAPGAGQPLAAKVHEELMGSRTNRMALSADGNHFAIQMAKGSRIVVLIDGVEGPEFDDIPFPLGTGPFSIVFTAGRSAYVGRRGTDDIAVVDGKEAGVVTTKENFLQGWRFWFSPDGKHSAWAALNPTGSWTMVVDGAKTQNYPNLDLQQTTFLDDRLIYVAQTPDQKWHAVVDGKPGPAYDKIEFLKTTPNGAHYAFFAHRPGASVAVHDGVEGKPYPAVADLEMAPDGRIAYLEGSPPNLLVLGGQEIPRTHTFMVSQGPGGQPSLHVAFSPDGKHAAYVQQAPSNAMQVVADGKAGREYGGVEQLEYSPDGSHLYYLANSPNQLVFPVMDGQELQGYNRVTDFHFSPDGKRYGFKGWQAGTNGGFSLVIDGKQVAKYNQNLLVESTLFSPDSKHYAYGAPESITSLQPVVDGEKKPAHLGNFQSQVTPILGNRITYPALVFSPDGNRIAYIGEKMDGSAKAAMILDGTVYQDQFSTYSYPSFSPDSKHFAWTVWNGKSDTIMVDGKTGPVYDNMMAPWVETVKFIDNHTYRFYGIKGQQIFRVTVDVGS